MPARHEAKSLTVFVVTPGEPAYPFVALSICTQPPVFCRSPTAAGLVQSISPGGAKGQFRPNAGEYLLDGRWDDAAPLAESRLRRRHERLGSASPWDARLGNAIGESGDVLTSLRELLVKYERWG